jgi:hypothetical protein
MTDEELNIAVTEIFEPKPTTPPQDDPDASPLGFWSAGYDQVWEPSEDFAHDPRCWSKYMQPLLWDRQLWLPFVRELHPVRKDCHYEDSHLNYCIWHGLCVPQRQRCEAFLRVFHKNMS